MAIPPCDRRASRHRHQPTVAVRPHCRYTRQLCPHTARMRLPHRGHAAPSRLTCGRWRGCRNHRASSEGPPTARPGRGRDAIHSTHPIHAIRLQPLPLQQPRLSANVSSRHRGTAPAAPLSQLPQPQPPSVPLIESRPDARPAAGTGTHQPPSTPPPPRHHPPRPLGRPRPRPALARPWDMRPHRVACPCERQQRRQPQNQAGRCRLVWPQPAPTARLCRLRRRRRLPLHQPTDLIGHRHLSTPVEHALQPSQTLLSRARPPLPPSPVPPQHCCRYRTERHACAWCRSPPSHRCC